MLKYAYSETALSYFVLLGETASESGGSAHGPPRNGSNLPVNQTVTIMPVSATGVPGPPTNLNIGMDYWSGHGNVPAAVPGVVVDGSQSQPWLQVCVSVSSSYFPFTVIQASYVIVL